MSSIASATAPFFLASKSPRRQEILQQIGVPFELVAVDVVEEYRQHELPLAYVERLAQSKASAGQVALSRASTAELDQCVVLGADTIVISPSGQVLEKPADLESGVAMLQELSARTHVVATAVSLIQGHRQLTRVSQTKVTFRELTPCECVEYWHTGEPQDKAGGYAIQGLGAVFVTQIVGSYSGVVGLPIETLLLLLKEFSVPWWHTADKAEFYNE